MKTLTLTAPAGYEFIPGDTERRILQPGEYGFEVYSQTVFYVRDQSTYEHIPLRKIEKKLPIKSMEYWSSNIYGQHITIPEGFELGDFDLLSILRSKGYKYFLMDIGSAASLTESSNLPRFGLHKK